MNDRENFPEFLDVNAQSNVEQVDSGMESADLEAGKPRKEWWAGCCGYVCFISGQ